MIFSAGRPNPGDVSRRGGRPYGRLVVDSGGMALVIKRTLSMRPDVDQMLAAHVERTPGATMSSTVNAALVEYLEAAALRAYREWDAQGDPEERAASSAFAAHDDASWASE
jgi:hypothetical protein